MTETGTPCADKFVAKKASNFSFVFIPSQLGSYMINSPLFAVPSLYITVIEAPEMSDSSSDVISSFLSTQFSYAEIDTESEGLEMEAGSTLVLHIVPMSAANTPIAYTLSSQCSVANSFYIISDGSTHYRGSFDQVDEIGLRLKAFIYRAGTLIVHPIVTCGSTSDSSVLKYEYPISCSGILSDRVCQKVVTPREASGVQIKIPRDHTTQEYLTTMTSSSTEIVEDVTKFFLQGENLVFDLIAVDIFGNQIKDKDLSGITAEFVFGKTKYSLSQT